jgi:hypothetical protein
MPPGHNLQPFPGDSQWVIILKDLISRFFNYIEQNEYFKILIACVWGNDERERGVSCLPVTFNY